VKDPAVREESHLDDMRAAIRGDFERLERRLGVQELMHVREAKPEPQVDVLAVVDTEAKEPLRPSWLARLVAAIPPRQV
jgi:hypothetical protein